MTQLIIIVLRLLIIAGLTYATTQFINNQLSLGDAPAWLLTGAYAAIGDWGLRFLHVGFYSEIWATIPYTIFFGIALLVFALGQSLMAAGRQEQALQTFQKAPAIAPRNVPLSVRYAEALMQAGRAREAHAILLDVFNNVAPTPEQIRLTALAASAAGDTGDAYYYMSEYHIANGDLPLAGKQLELALAAPGLTPVQRARFSARLKEIREVLAESARGRWRSREASGDAGMMP